MLTANVSFAGPTGQLLNYLGNCDAIQAPKITRTGVGQYTVTFLTAREIDAAKIASAIISVDCQSPSGTLTFTNVVPSPVSVFNANANSDFRFQISFKIEVQQLVVVLLLITAVGFVDRPVVMLSFVAKNASTWAPGVRTTEVGEAGWEEHLGPAFEEGEIMAWSPSQGKYVNAVGIKGGTSVASKGAVSTPLTGTPQEKVDKIILEKIKAQCHEFAMRHKGMSAQEAFETCKPINTWEAMFEFRG